MGQSASRMNLAKLRSSVLTVHIRAPSFGPASLLPFSIRAWSSICSSSLRVSTKVHGEVSSPSKFHPLHRLIHSTAAQTARVHSSRSCESDSTRMRFVEIARMRSGAWGEREVMKMDGEA